MQDARPTFRILRSKCWKIHLDSQHVSPLSPGGSLIHRSAVIRSWHEPEGKFRNHFLHAAATCLQLLEPRTTYTFSPDFLPQSIVARSLPYPETLINDYILICQPFQRVPTQEPKASPLKRRANPNMASPDPSRPADKKAPSSAPAKYISSSGHVLET